MSLDPEGSQQKRAYNRDQSAQILRSHNIPFESRNGGAHLIVHIDDSRTVDFWPGTGKFIARAPLHHEGRGVFNLLKLIKRLAPPNATS